MRGTCVFLRVLRNFKSTFFTEHPRATVFVIPVFRELLITSRAVNIKPNYLLLSNEAD